MKKASLLFSTLALLTLMALNACTNSNDDNLPNSNVTNQLTTSGDWKVSYYWDKDKDETNDFSGYSFLFKDNGVLEALKNGVVSTGTWQVNSSSNKLIIFMGATNPLENLNDDWIIVEKTNSVIKLKDDNTTHLEELHFMVQ